MIEACKDCQSKSGFNVDLDLRFRLAGIRAHFMGYSQIFGGNYWMLGAITPVPEAQMIDMLPAHLKPKKK